MVIFDTIWLQIILKNVLIKVIAKREVKLILKENVNKGMLDSNAEHVMQQIITMTLS